MTKPRVAMMAVAADEAAYIAHYIYHHLSCGFSPIAVVVNNTTDNTRPILHAIAEKCDDIIVLEGDHIPDYPKAETVQQNMYWHAFGPLRERLAADDYIMPLDIDEFWTNPDPAEGIADYLAPRRQYDSISFHWFVPDNDDGEFAPPFASDHLRGRWTNKLKSVWKAGGDFKLLHPHNIRFRHQGGSQIAASGIDLDGGKLRAVGRPDTMYGPFIHHRMHRSRTEYLAMLTNRTLGVDYPIKYNRGGYRIYRRQNPEYFEYDLPLGTSAAWQEGYAQFVEEMELADLITGAQQDVLARSGLAWEIYNTLDEEAKMALKRIFNGTGLLA